MATRTKPRTKAKSKPVAAVRTKTKTTKQTKSIGGNIGPLGWIIAAAIVGYIGWAVSSSGDAIDGADAAVGGGKPAVVRIYPTTGIVASGGTLSLMAETYDGNGQEITSGVEYTWKATGASGASGEVTGQGNKATFRAGTQPGIVAVQVAARGSGQSLSAAANVVIQAAPGIQRVSIAPMVGHVPTGKTTDFTALAYDSNGKSITGGVTYKWRVVNPGTDASVAKTSGNVMTLNGGTKEGVANVLLDATYQGKTVNSYVQVAVQEQNKLGRIKVSPYVGNVKANQSTTLTAEAFDTNNVAIESGVTYKWTLLSPSNGATLLQNKGTAKVNAGSTKGLLRVRVEATKGGTTISQATMVLVR